MKTVDGVEKGLLRRAFVDMLPEDVRARKKSAYPAAQDPAYHQAIRDLALEVVDDGASPIQPLINAWLERYHVELVL
jgi:asparagine synthase (glutamine-hydrolysing)